MRKSAFALLGILAFSYSSISHAACSVPNNLANGQVADANQVMANFNQITTCINTGNLTVPPVQTLQINGLGGNATIQAPSVSGNYNFNLPITSGSSGQVLVSGGGGTSSMYWATLAGATAPSPIDGVAVGRPSAAAFTWRNQGAATYSEHANGPITLTIPTQSGDQVRGLEQTLTYSAPYTLTVKIDSLLWNSDYFVSGIYAVDDVGKLLIFNFQQDGTIQIGHFNSASTFTSNSKLLSVNQSPTWWLRMTNDGANWNFYLSRNGADWINLYSEPSNQFLNPTVKAMGVYGENNDTLNVSVPSTISLWSFELASGAGTNSHW